MHEGMKMTFLLTGTAIVTYWFYLKLLNPFIDAAVAIIACGIRVIFVFIFTLVYKPLLLLQKPFIRPAWFIGRIFHSVWDRHFRRMVLFFLLGTSILLLDHFYATKLYDADQMTFYRFMLQGKKYWITSTALFSGGFFITGGILLFIDELFRLINFLLDRSFQIHITIQR